MRTSTRLVNVGATEVAVQRRLEVEGAVPGVGHRQLGFQRSSAQSNLYKRSVDKS